LSTVRQSKSPAAPCTSAHVSTGTRVSEAPIQLDRSDLSAGGRRRATESSALDCDLARKGGTEGGSARLAQALQKLRIYV
jgi:hypothetical protein